MTNIHLGVLIEFHANYIVYLWCISPLYGASYGLQKYFILPNSEGGRRRKRDPHV